MRRVGFYLEAISRLAHSPQWGGRCTVCGWGLQLEFAHLKPTGVNGRGRGRSRRYHDIRAHPECYVLMCHDHHLEFDQGKTGGKEWGP